MSNAQLAGAFEKLARLMELLGEDSFRVSAHSKAARAIEGAVVDLAPIAVAAGKGDATARAKLGTVEGLGPKTTDKLIELATTGQMKDLIDAASKVPAGLIPLLDLQGVGPKSIRLWWQEGGVTDLASLKKIIDDGSILKLPRMGEKAVEKLKSAIAMFDEMQASPRLRLGEAHAVAQRVMERLRRVPGVTRLEAAGSLRRGKDSVGDIDILIETSKPKEAMDAFCAMRDVRTILVRGENKTSVRVALDLQSRWDEPKEPDPALPPPVGPSVQVDLRVVPKEQFGASLAYFTGSKEHNIILRQRALDRGLTLNEYGLFPDDKNDDRPPHQRGVKAVASATEEEIHKALGLPYIPPELREGRGEGTLTQTPALVSATDIKAELHSHTTASDGVMSIVELAKEAMRRGFHTLAVTDHSQSQPQARGLKPERLKQHIAAIREAQAEVPGIVLLAGSEVDILLDGRLDYDDELLAQLDVIVASPHNALTQDSKVATKRLIRAASHPLVNIIGHPTGRLVGRRPGLEPDMAALIEACKANDVALEINSHWMRLDLRDVHVRMAVEAGAFLAINCDVHHAEDYDNLQFGVQTARRGWATAASVVNTWEAKRLRAWLRRGR